MTPLQWSPLFNKRRNAEKKEGVFEAVGYNSEVGRGQRSRYLLCPDSGPLSVSTSGILDDAALR